MQINSKMLAILWGSDLHPQEALRQYRTLTQTSLGLFTRSSWSDWCHSHRHCKGRVSSKRNLDLGFERQKCAPQLWIWALCFLERKLGQHYGWQGSSLFSLNDLRKEGVHSPPSAVPSSSAFRASCRLLCSLPPSIHLFGLPFFCPYLCPGPCPSL